MKGLNKRSNLKNKIARMCALQSNLKKSVGFWCNDPMKGGTHDMQVEVGVPYDEQLLLSLRLRKQLYFNVSLL